MCKSGTSQNWFSPARCRPAYTYTAGYTIITCCNIAQIMTSVKLPKAISLYWFCFSVCCGLIDHSVMWLITYFWWCSGLLTMVHCIFTGEKKSDLLSAHRCSPIPVFQVWIVYVYSIEILVWLLHWLMTVIKPSSSELNKHGVWLSSMQRPFTVYKSSFFGQLHFNSLLTATLSI